MITRTKNIVVFAFLAMCIFSFNSSLFAGDDPKPGEAYDPIPAVMHHIGDAHQFHIVGDLYLPLPCIAYSSSGGFFFALSNGFEYSHADHISKKAIDGYVLYHDELMRVKEEGFPAGSVDITEVKGGEHHHVDEHGTKKEEDSHAHAVMIKQGDKTYTLEPASKLQGMTSWYDFSITKNVFGMLLGVLILFLLFSRITKSYREREKQAPKGLQSLLEPVIVFIRDEAVIPSIGPRWEKYFPFIMSLFFFILINDLMGLIPFFPGSANITGNIGVTMVLAFFTFIVVTISGNKHYWQHIFWMPGVPIPVRILLAPIEFLGIFIKPATLFIRLFANITAGHIIILCLTSLIFVFNSTGQLGGAPGGIAVAVPFVLFMNFIELLVAFLQAFIFALLSSLYIGAAIEDHHHEEAHH